MRFDLTNVYIGFYQAVIILYFIINVGVHASNDGKELEVHLAKYSFGKTTFKAIVSLLILALGGFFSA